MTLALPAQAARSFPLFVGGIAFTQILGKEAALWVGLIGSMAAALAYWRLDRLTTEC